MLRPALVLSSLVLTLAACGGKTSKEANRFTETSKESASPVITNDAPPPATAIAVPAAETAPGKLATCTQPPSNVPTKPEQSSGPSSEAIVGNRIPIHTFLCGDEFRSFMGSDLGQTQAVSLKLYVEDYDTDIGAAVKEMKDSAQSKSLREEILKQSYASIGALDVTDGLYRIVLCDLAQHDSCNTMKNVGAIANVTIKGGQLVSFLGGSGAYLPAAGNPLGSP